MKVVHEPGESPPSTKASQECMEISPETSPEANSKEESSKLLEAKEAVGAAMEISPQKTPEFSIVQAHVVDDETPKNKELDVPVAGVQQLNLEKANQEDIILPSEERFVARLIHDLLKAEENAAKVRSSLYLYLEELETKNKPLSADEKKDLNWKIADLGKQLAECKKFSASLKATRLEQDEEIATLKKMKREKEEEVLNLEAQVSTMDGGILRANAKIKELDGDIMTMNSDLYQITVDLEQANAIINDLQEDVVMLTAELMQANLQIHGRDAVIQFLNHNIEWQAINMPNHFVPENIQALDPPEDFADDHPEVIDPDSPPPAIDDNGPHAA